MTNFDPVYFDKVVAALKAKHNQVVAALIQKVPEAAPPKDKRWTEKQQRVLTHFSKWEYGCQHSQVLELVSILSDIPMDELKLVAKTRRSGYNSGSQRFVSVYQGMFVKLLRKPLTYTIKLPVGSVGLLGYCPPGIYGDTSGSFVTKAMNTLNAITGERMVNKDDTSWRGSFAVATDAEIDQFFTALRVACEQFDRWDYFVKYFKKIVPTN